MKIAVMGFGVVGSGVVKLIQKNAPVIRENTGAFLEVKRILDIRDFDGSEFAPLMTKSFSDIENDDEIEVVVETMGGLNPAFDFVSRCLKKKKHVVSSNKELVATYGTELLDIFQNFLPAVFLMDHHFFQVVLNFLIILPFLQFFLVHFVGLISPIPRVKRHRREKKGGCHSPRDPRCHAVLRRISNLSCFFLFMAGIAW